MLHTGLGLSRVWCFANLTRQSLAGSSWLHHQCRAQAYATTAADGPLVLPAREPVQPGDSVHLSFKFKATISVSPGDHEAFEVASSAAWLSLQRSRHTTHDGFTALELREASEIPPPGHFSVQVKAPARFVSLDISTKGGDVYVETLKEASLKVASFGGDIRVPSVKGNHVLLWSGGGSITAAVTAAKAEIDSNGGDIQLKSLVGQSVAVDSQGGRVAVGACYADEAAISSGGAPVTVATLQCQAGQVSSQGGSLTVDSFEGSARLSSQGGSIEVHIQPDVQELHLDSGGGDISLSLAHDVRGTLVYPRTASVVLPEGLSSPDSMAVSGRDGIITVALQPSSGKSEETAEAAPLSRLQAAARMMQRAPEPESVQSRRKALSKASTIQLEPGAGKVIMLRNSWMDSVRRKLRRET